MLPSRFERASNGFAHSIVMKLTLFRTAVIVVLLAVVAIYFLLRPEIEYKPLGGGFELKVTRSFFGPEGSSVGCELYYKNPEGQHVALCEYLGAVYVDKELAVYTCGSDSRIFVARSGTSATDVTEAVARYGFKQIGEERPQFLELVGIYCTIYQFERHGDQFQMIASVSNLKPPAAGGLDYNLHISIPFQQIVLFSGLN